ncbi:hypothetical protein BC332_11024 [Capsicum chinense]|nr:hypothetical protein BC332_11024 [Capsicum chinense]
MGQLCVASNIIPGAIDSTVFIVPVDYSSVVTGRLYVATDNIPGTTDFSPDFAASSECSSCKCQNCKVKHDRVINAINALTVSIKEMTSKRGVIPSKRISYLDTPLEIKEAKRRRKDASKESSIIKKSKIAIPLSLSCTDHSTGLPWHLVEEVYITINSGDEFHWVLAVVVLKERRIRVYDSMLRRRRSRPSSEIQKLAKILPTYLDMSEFLDQKVHTDKSKIEAYRDKMANLFDVQYVDGIAQQTIGIVVLLLPPMQSIEAIDYKYQMMDLMPDYSVKDMLLFYGNMEKRKLRSRTQPTLKIHDDQSRIP